MSLKVKIDKNIPVKEWIVEGEDAFGNRIVELLDVPVCYIVPIEIKDE